MNIADIKKGQTVKHRNGFTGIVTEVNAKISVPEVTILITDKGNSRQEVGEKYVALPKYIVCEVKSCNPENSTNNSTNNSTIKVSLGSDVKYEGSVKDFKKFVEIINIYN